MGCIIFLIPGKPIAKARPRFFRRGKFVGTYNPQQTEEGRFLFHVQQQWIKRLPMEGPLRVEMEFVMPIPKGTSKKKNDAMARGDVNHLKKPDVSNLIKFCEDCLNGFVWKDDSQIVSITAIKRYGGDPHTRILIEEF